MARGDQRLRRAHRTARPPQGRARNRDDDGIIPVLARTASEVEAAAQRGRVLSSDRTKFQVVAVLARQERARTPVRVREPSARTRRQLPLERRPRARARPPQSSRLGP